MNNQDSPTLPAAQSKGDAAGTQHEICAFSKSFELMGYAEMAQRIAELGFDGVEVTVRPGGHVEPERAEEQLPAVVQALREHDLNLTAMTTDILSADQSYAERNLRLAASLGIRRYRMGYHRYDLNRPIDAQLAALRPVFRDLAQLNREAGIQGLYQNHSGADLVGAPVWDLHQLVQPLSPDHLGVSYDLLHAAVEGGRCWPLHLQLMREHVRLLYVKDFRWSGSQLQLVPLGEGVVDRRAFAAAIAAHPGIPISLQIEYVDHLDPAAMGQMIEAHRNDLTILRQWLAS